MSPRRWWSAWRWRCGSTGRRGTPMRLRINPWLFLAKLVAFLLVAYWLWMPVAPYYTQILLRASQVGIWLTEFSTDPNWNHQTQLLVRPDISPTAIFFYQGALFPKYGLDPQGI